MTLKPLSRVACISSVRLFMLLLVFPALTQAATFTVTNVNDTGTGSLRKAVADALAAGVGPHSIYAGATTGSIDLQSALPAITNCNIAIYGPTSGTLTINRGVAAPFRFFYVNNSAGAATLTLNNLTLTNGDAGPNVSDYGGAFVVEGATLNLNLCTVSGCKSNASGSNGGGAITALQGAAAALPFVNLKYCTFSSNESYRGGAITLLAGTATISNSTFSGNTVVAGGSSGGAIFGTACTVEASQSTFSGNTAASTGGAIRISGTSSLTLSGCTVANNRGNTDGTSPSPGGGLSANTAVVVSLINTLIVGNFDGASPSTTADDTSWAASGVTDKSAKNSVVGVHNGQAFNTTTASQIGSSGLPKLVSLGVLANNGGLTQTHALQVSGSELAIDSGSNSDASTIPSDQRGTGYNRFVNSTVDIGAFEFAATGPAAANVTQLGVPAQINNSNTLFYAVPPGNNRFLVVTVSAVAASGSPTFTGGTFRGAFPLVEVLKRQQGTMAHAMYYVNLASNTAASPGDIVVNVTNGSVTCLGAMTLQNVYQSVPFNHSSSSVGATANIGSSLTHDTWPSIGQGTLTGVVLDLFGIADSTGVGTQTPGIGQSVVHNIDAPSGSLFTYQQTSLRPGTGSPVTMSWTSSGQSMVHLSAHFQAAPPPASDVFILANGNVIANNDITPSTTDFTDFGSVDIDGATLARTYSVGNTGPLQLTIGTIGVTGAAASDFTVTQPSTTTFNNGASTTFQITFNPSQTGPRNAVVSFSNNDPDENPFTFNITGMGTSTANSAPVITSDGGVATVTSSLPENSTAVSTITAADYDLPAQTLTFSKSGPDQARFNLTQAGVLTFAANPDFEAPADQGTDNVYNVTVTVTDSGTPPLNASQNFVITILNANDPPTISDIADQGIAPNSSTGALNFTIGDADPSSMLTINAPAGIAGTMKRGNAGFGPQLYDVTADVVVAVPADATSPLTNNVVGKIVIIDRGLTTFLVKASYAQAAGAVGVIIADNTAAAAPPQIGGTDPTITIPVVSVTQADGAILKANATGLNARLHFGAPGASYGNFLLTGTSSNPTLVPNANIVFGGGTGASRTVTVTPAAGQTGTTTISVTVSDGVATATDSFQVAVSSLSLSIVADAASKAEGNAGTNNFTFTVSRAGGTTGDVTANYAVSGAAVNAQDFIGGTLPSGQVTIANGSASTTLNIPVSGDTAVEADEAFTVTLSSPSVGYVLATAAASSTITNDDADVSVAVVPSSVSEDGSGNLTYTFARGGSTAGTLVANIQVSGAASFGGDYNVPSITGGNISAIAGGLGTITFSAGSSQVVMTVDPVADNEVETDEAATFTVLSGTGYSVTGSPASATITNDDSTITVFVSNGRPEEDSGETMLYTFTRSSGPVTNALTLNLSVAGSATPTTDYTTADFTTFNTPPGVATVTFAAGSATATARITPVADTTPEANERVDIAIVDNGTPAATGGYTKQTFSNSSSNEILDEDTQFSVTSVTVNSVGESSGTPMTFTFTRTGYTADSRSMLYSIGGTANTAYDVSVTSSSGLPYSPLGNVGRLTFAAGETTGTVTVTPVADTIIEPDDTIIVGVRPPSAIEPYTVTGSSITGTIVDDDTGTVSITKITDGEEGPPIVNGKFRITQSAFSDTNTVISYSVTGTATPGAGNDYATLSGTATIATAIPTGQTTVDIDVAVLADAISEGTETVIVTLTSISSGDPQITLAASPNNTATVNIISGPVPVTSALGDVVTDNPAPGADGSTNIGDFDLLRRSAYLGENGDLVFSGYLLVQAGPPVVTNNDFQGLWAKDAANPLRLVARSGSTAPGTGGAVFDILPEVPAISDGGDATFLASLRIGTGSPAVTASNDTGVWTTLSVLGANPQPVRAIREGSALAPPSNAVITKFATGVYATASAGGGVIVFSGTESDGKTGVYVMTMSLGLPSAAVTTAKEGSAAPGAGGEVWDHLASGLTDPARMDSAGNFTWAAKVKPSGKEGIWYAPIATGIAAKVVIAGDAAPGTTTTFSRFLNLPVMGGVNNIAFHAYVAATGDNAANTKADGVWKGVAPAAISTYTLVIRCGDSGVAGLPGGALVGNMWSPWMSNGNHIALRAWVDIDGNGSSGSGPDVTGLFTDADNTMRLVVKQGDAAPGMPGGATFNFMDLPVIGGVEQMAFLGTVTGGGTTAANNQGIWRQAANGGALSLVARTGDTVSTSQGVKTISKLDFPGTSQPAFTADRRWEQLVMDSTGRMVIQATFTDGTTGQLLTP